MSRRLRAADPEQDPLEAPELVPLVRLLTRVEGFAIAFLECNVPVSAERIASELIRGLEARGRRGRLVRLEEAEENLLGHLRGLTPPAPPGEALFVLGFERAIPSQVAFPPALTRLNRAREQFRELALPLILVLPRYALDQLSREAPDFWAWRSGVFEVREEEEHLERMVHDVTRPGPGDYGNLSAVRKREHLEVLRGLLAELEARGDGERARGELHYRIARLLRSMGQWPEAEAAAAKALELAREAGDRRAIAAAGHKLAWVTQDRGDLEAAEEGYRKSLEVGEALGDKTCIAASYHQLGMVAQDRGDLAAAEDWYRKALEVFEALGSKTGIASSYHQLGRVAQDRGDLATAEDWYRKALEIDEALGDKTGIAASYHHLGMVAQARGDLEAAEDRYRKSLEIKEALGNRPDKASTYGQLGLLAEARGEPAAALDWTIRCVTLFPEFPHPATGPGPQHLARLTGISGKDALEAGWQRLTGGALPAAVADFVARQLARAEDASEPSPPTARA